MSSAFETASWHGALTFLELLLPAIKSATPPAREELQDIARDYRDHAHEMVGEMPRLVAWFIKEYE